MNQKIPIYKIIMGEILNGYKEMKSRPSNGIKSYTSHQVY